MGLSKALQTSVLSQFRGIADPPNMPFSPVCMKPVPLCGQETLFKKRFQRLLPNEVPGTHPFLWPISPVRAGNTRHLGGNQGVLRSVLWLVNPKPGPTLNWFGVIPLCEFPSWKTCVKPSFAPWEFFPRVIITNYGPNNQPGKILETYQPSSPPNVLKKLGK